MPLQTSKALAAEYKIGADKLINTYCQLKEKHPSTAFPRVSNRIWWYLTLYWFWESVALMRNKGQ